jgi:hypothetical protein
MKKLPSKFRMPLMGMIMAPTMLMGLPAIMLWRNLPEGAPFIEPWLNAMGQTVPYALVMAITVGSLANLLITKVLIEPKIE